MCCTCFAYLEDSNWSLLRMARGVTILDIAKLDGSESFTFTESGFLFLKILVSCKDTFGCNSCFSRTIFLIILNFLIKSNRYSTYWYISGTFLFLKSSNLYTFVSLCTATSESLNLNVFITYFVPGESARTFWLNIEFFCYWWRVCSWAVISSRLICSFIMLG